MIRVGIIGFGYWGKNIARNFHSCEELEVAAISDLHPDNLKRAQKLYPKTKVTTDYKEILTSKDIDAVAIITPVKSHYEISKLALQNGKHIFVEKPFTENCKQAEELVNLAEQKSLIIMVDHTFIFTESVKKIKELLKQDAIGEIYYYDAIRVNLGLFRHDVNVIWDLAPHDFSIMEYLIEQKPKAIAAHGMDHFGRDLFNTAYVTVYFDKLIAHFNFNWLSPVKIRSTYIGGQKKMIVWDDLENDEKVKVYDKGVTDDDNLHDKSLSHRINYRLGDIWIPALDPNEALNTEAHYFGECLTKSKKPINDGRSGWDVIKMLEATDASIKSQGKIINV